LQQSKLVNFKQRRVIVKELSQAFDPGMETIKFSLNIGEGCWSVDSPHKEGSSITQHAGYVTKDCLRGTTWFPGENFQ
jgi:hypothetical protein